MTDDEYKKKREKRLLDVKEGHLDSHGDICKGTDPDCDTCFLFDYFGEEIRRYQRLVCNYHEVSCWGKTKEGVAFLFRGACPDCIDMVNR